MTKEEKLRKEALEYHERGRRGKIEVVPTKPYSSQKDLSLAYSPGVAAPCEEIAAKPSAAYKYTAKGNLVGVITNGTAVLGLGNIGALASKPVMEGKGLLFKIFADLDVFDIEIDETDPDKFIEIVKAIAPTFGGINLEDIKAPEAFEIERRLKEELDIPVMHDDQHGTAIISAAALLNALDIAGKDITSAKFVINGAGASATACTKLYMKLGAKSENIMMCDSKGIINKDRVDLTPEKEFFRNPTSMTTLAEAVKGVDVLIGLSRGNIFTPEMLTSMADSPIVFAMANPTPEIDYTLAKKTRKDLIMATGRSDFPNQVNNVLGFPFIFRGALDVAATTINEEMKLAAVHSLADLAKEPVPEYVMMAYNEKNMSYGTDYIIPKPFDNRLMDRVSMAVAKAAMDSGVAKKPIKDWDAYREELLDRKGDNDKMLRAFKGRARSNVKRVVLTNGDEYRVLKAAQIVAEEGLAIPILLGNKETIQKIKEENGIETEFEIIDPKSDEMKEKVEAYAADFWKKHQRNGITIYEAIKNMKSREYFGPMMVEKGDADAVLTGFSKSYDEALKIILQVIDKQKGVRNVTGMSMLLKKDRPMFFADTSVMKEPSTADLINSAKMIYSALTHLNIQPNIAMIGFENFRSNSQLSDNVIEAVATLHKVYPDMIVDGPIQPDYALDEELLRDDFPFCKLNGEKVNTFIFPDSISGSLSSKVLRGLHKAPMIGPILLGLSKPAHIMQSRAKVDEIANLILAAVVDAQLREQ